MRKVITRGEYGSGSNLDGSVLTAFLVLVKFFWRKSMKAICRLMN
jgi:hypothetical protein